MGIAEDLKTLEGLRREFEVVLNVLQARIGGASDTVDWGVINSQTQDALRIGIKARQLCLQIERENR